MNTDGKNGPAIGHAYGQSMAEPMARYGTVRNGTVRRQDSDENPSVPDAAGPVDNPKTSVQHVEFDLPKPVWFELAGIAEKRDTTVAALIADAIKHVVVGEQSRLAAARARRKLIVDLAREGHTDAVICERLGETRSYVSTVRRNANVRANRPGMATHQKETA